MTRLTDSSNLTAIGLREPHDQDFIINIDENDNYALIRKDNDHAKKQVAYALKPKLSGNIDLRLNRLNLRKIEKLIREINFFENGNIHDKV